MKHNLELESYEKIMETAKKAATIGLNNIVILLEGDANDADYVTKVKVYSIEEFTEDVYNRYKTLVINFGNGHDIDKINYDNMVNIYRKYPEFFDNVDEKEMAEYTEEAEDYYCDYLWDAFKFYDIIPRSEYGFCHTLCNISVLYMK